MLASQHSALGQHITGYIDKSVLYWNLLVNCKMFTGTFRARPGSRIILPLSFYSW
jgi:hypothetical protein